MSQTALLIVDLQSDFLPTGSLAVPGGQKIIPNLLRLSEQFDTVVASRDWHPAEHFSFSSAPEFRDGSWPPHCVAGTPGAELHPLIAELRPYLVDKGTDPAVEAYSAFSGTGLAELLREQEVSRVVVGGLALDYCVLHSALDARREGFQTVLALDASKPVSPEGGQAALRQLREAGVQIKLSLQLTPPR